MLKLKGMDKQPNVKVVFQAAIEHPKRDDRLKLFGNDRILRIKLQTWRRELQKRGIVVVLWLWENGVTETNVKLKRQTSLGKVGQQCDTEAFVSVTLFDFLNRHGLRIKHNAIIFAHLVATNRLEAMSDKSLVQRSVNASQIRVARDPEHWSHPYRENRRTLEDKTPPIIRKTQPIKESFNGIFEKEIIHVHASAQGLVL